MDMPQVVYGEPEEKEFLEWDDVLDYFNVSGEVRERLDEKWRKNDKNSQILFHLNRFVRMVKNNLNADDSRVDAFCRISCILESLNSPLVPVVDFCGFDFEEWKRMESPVEYWNIDDVVRECKLAYWMVDEELPLQSRYTKGDVYDMLCDLESLGRIYSFDDVGAYGVYKSSGSGERESFFKNDVAKIRVHRVKYPKPLERVYDDFPEFDVEVVK